MNNIEKLSKKDLLALVSSINEISFSLDSSAVLKKVMHQACNLLNAEGASIFMVDEKTKCLIWKVATNLDEKICRRITIPPDKGIVGHVYKNRTLLNVSDASSDPRFYKKVDEMTHLKTKSCLTVPLIVENKKLGVVQVINKRDNSHFNERDEILLTEFSNTAGIIINKALLHQKIVENEKIKTDLELASLIQKRLLPQNSFYLKGVKIKGFYKPAMFVSGDYYDYIKISNNHVLFVLGDVSGKGAQASLLMASLKSFINTSCETNKISLSSLANRINKYFYKITSPDKFITLFLGLVDLDTYDLTYVNAGHEKPLLLHKNGDVVSLQESDLIIGVNPEYIFTEKSRHLKDGDKLIIFTDGITEAMNRNENMFGVERLIKIIQSAKDDFKLLFHVLNEEIMKFTNGTEQSDDITYMLLSVDQKKSS